ncbi:hypothetical protein Droror1_Dr00018880 [Drosera rotundifolia]
MASLISLLKSPKLFPLRFTSPTITALLFSTLCPKNPIFSSPTIDPPIPKKVPFNVTAHGITLSDPYHWMSNINDPDFIDDLEKENLYAQDFMADTEGKQREMEMDMIKRLPVRVCTPPEKWGDWLYYQYIPEGKDYPVLCRRLSGDGRGWMRSVMNFLSGGTRREEILLDWNEIAGKYGYVHVGTCRISPDHKFLAYSLDTTGSEKFTMNVKSLSYGTEVPECGADRVVSIVWAQSSSALFYTTCDENQRPYRVMCTKVGSQAHTVIFTEDDPNYCVDISCTKDCKFITVNSNSRTSSEVYLIDAAYPMNDLQRVHKRIPGVHYFLEHHHGSFYVLTNYPPSEAEQLWDGKSYLAICRAEELHHANWQNIILPGEGASIENIDIFEQHLVLSVCKNGSSLMCSIRLPIDINCKRMLEIEDLSPWFFPVPLESCQIASCSNHDFLSSIYRVVLTSPVVPDIIMDYDMKNKRYTVVHQEGIMIISSDPQSSSPYLDPVNVKADHSPDKLDQKPEEIPIPTAYACEVHEVASHDGVKIPLTVIYSRSKLKKGNCPGLIRVYGAYGELLEKSCSVEQLSLLDSGWVIGYADVRGGGGGDSSWHKQGSGLHKINSVYDFVACCKYMVDEDYVQKDKLAAVGSSAGCLLIGAAINMYPDMFSAAVLKSPFLDICNTLMDTSLPLSIMDHEEFGNPLVEPDFKSIMKYSPYDNIASGLCYPPMLVKASFNDSRVGIWEAAKWVAKVRDSTCTKCSSALILKTEMTGGHFDEGGRYGHCKDVSYDYAFLMKVMGYL